MILNKITYVQILEKSPKILLFHIDCFLFWLKHKITLGLQHVVVLSTPLLRRHATLLWSPPPSLSPTAFAWLPPLHHESPHCLTLSRWGMRKWVKPDRARESLPFTHCPHPHASCPYAILGFSSSISRASLLDRGTINSSSSW